VHIYLLGILIDVSLVQTQILFGHHFRLSKRLEIVPMIGCSNWELSTTESRLFNPGAEATKTTDRNDFLFASAWTINSPGIQLSLLTNTRSDDKN